VFAAALLDGALRLDQFDERPVEDRIMTLALKASRRHDNAAPRMSSDPSTRFVLLDITLKDGTKIHRRFDGLPSLTDPEQKFKNATLGSSAFADIPELVRSMESEADLARLLSLLNQTSL
jgi:2-methylcitrate dehydratase PrpD